MIYKLQKSQQIEVPEARINLEMLLKDWKSRAIDDNSRAIREVKALDDASFQEMRQQLIAGIRPVLPWCDEHASNIIDGLLRLDESPYQTYLKDHFRWQLNAMATEMINKKLTEIYEPAMRDFARQEVKQGNLGVYFLELKKLDLTSEKLNAIEFTLHSNAQLEAKVKVNSDKQIRDVERDEVGLDAHLNDLNPKFHQFERTLLLNNDLTKIYNSYIKEIFKSSYQSVAIDKISTIINAYVSRNKKAA